MSKGTIRSVRERPLVVVGAAGRRIDVTRNGEASTRMGGLGYDIVSGVDRAGGTCRAVLLVSAGVALEKFGSVEKRRLAITVCHSKEQFEFIDESTFKPIRALHAPGPKQIAELQSIISNERAAIRGSHVHYAGTAVIAAIANVDPLPISSSVSISCSDVTEMSSAQTNRLPNLIFLDGNCGEVAASCAAVRAVGGDRAVVHGDQSKGITVIVDGIQAVSFGLGFRDRQDYSADVGVIVGSTLVGLGYGLSLEESVASALLIGETSNRSILPQAVASLDVDVRALRVMELMTTSPVGEAADRYRNAVALLVVREGLLLVGTKPSEKAFVPGRLYLPGGKIEEGESPSEAARRELLEETGLTVDMLELCGFSCYEKNGQLYEFAQYLATAAGDPKPKDDMDSLEWRPSETLERERLFDLTWAQLYLLRDDQVVI